MRYNHKLSSLILTIIAVASSFSLQSCKDQPDEFKLSDGTPTIYYIRPASYSASDSLLVEAAPQTSICLVGSNLKSIQQMYFNDKKAVLNTSYITDNTLFVQIPSDIPDEVSDKIYMITQAHDTLTYDFHVVIPAPVVTAMKNEWVKVGEDAVITGQYFIDDPNQPLTVTFTGISNSISVKVPAENFKSITRSQLVFTVPEGAEEGQIEVASVYGKGLSKFYFRDSRNLITNFDGATDVIPQGWNIAATYSDVNGVDGQYVQLGPKETEGGWVEELKLPFWCGNWNGDPMSITSGPGIPLRNFLDFSDWQNNKYIRTSADEGGLDLPRALYRPWETTGSFDTGDEWITVTIPLTDFVYNFDGTKVNSTMSIDSFDSFVIWPTEGGVAGTTCTPIFRYDNIRVVPNL